MKKRVMGIVTKEVDEVIEEISVRGKTYIDKNIAKARFSIDEEKISDIRRCPLAMLDSAGYIIGEVRYIPLYVLKDIGIKYTSYDATLIRNNSYSEFEGGRNGITVDDLEEYIDVLARVTVIWLRGKGLNEKVPAARRVLDKYKDRKVNLVERYVELLCELGIESLPQSELNELLSEIKKSELNKCTTIADKARYIECISNRIGITLPNTTLLLTHEK